MHHTISLFDGSTGAKNSSKVSTSLSTLALMLVILPAALAPALAQGQGGGPVSFPVRIVRQTGPQVISVTKNFGTVRLAGYNTFEASVSFPVDDCPVTSPTRELWGTCGGSGNDEGPGGGDPDSGGSDDAGSGSSTSTSTSSSATGSGSGSVEPGSSGGVAGGIASGSERAIQRTAPALLALFSVVAILAHQYMAKGVGAVRIAAWYTKTGPTFSDTFSDALALVRRKLWSQEAPFCGPVRKEETVKLPRKRVVRLTYAVSYGA
jgi:hypothetical protein